MLPVKLFGEGDRDPGSGCLQDAPEDRGSGRLVRSRGTEGPPVQRHTLLRAPPGGEQPGSRCQFGCRARVIACALEHLPEGHVRLDAVGLQTQ